MNGVISLHNLLVKSLDFFLHFLLFTVQFRHFRLKPVDLLFVFLNFTLLADKLQTTEFKPSILAFLIVWFAKRSAWTLPNFKKILRARLFRIFTTQYTVLVTCKNLYHFKRLTEGFDRERSCVPSSSWCQSLPWVWYSPPSLCGAESRNCFWYPGSPYQSPPQSVSWSPHILCFVHEIHHLP